jgi:hypothetical protein
VNPPSVNPRSAELEALRKAVWIGFFLRVAVAVALHLSSAESVFAPDHETYHFFSAWLARYWAGDVITYPWKLLEPGPHGYYYILGVLYSVLGDSEMVPKVLNAMVGAASILLTFDLAQRMTQSTAVALRAARYSAFFPSLVLWSAVNIRDCWVVLLILLICRQAMVLQERLSVVSFVVMAGAVWAVMQFRDYIFFAVTAPAAVSFLVRNRRHVLRNTLVGMLLAGVIIYADRAAGSDRRLRNLDLETLHEIRQGTAVGGSRFDPGADISTPAKAAVFLPKGLAFFLLAPFPWSVSNLRQTLTVPEMLFFYVLLPSILSGLGVLVRRQLASSLMVILITAGLTFGYALGEANAGTAYRHRAQVLPFYLIFAAVGVEKRNQRRLGVRVPAGEAVAIA